MRGKMYGGLFEHMRTVIERNGKFYFVSTNDTEDCGLETMVFSCNREGKVLEWGELYGKRHDNMTEAILAHKRVCETFQPSEGVSRDDSY